MKEVRKRSLNVNTRHVNTFQIELPSLIDSLQKNSLMFKRLNFSSCIRFFYSKLEAICKKLLSFTKKLKSTLKVVIKVLVQYSPFFAFIYHSDKMFLTETNRGLLLIQSYKQSGPFDCLSSLVFREGLIILPPLCHTNCAASVSFDSPSQC